MLGTFSKYAVDNSVFHCLCAAHEIIAFGVDRNLFNGLAGMFGQDCVQTAASMGAFLLAAGAKGKRFALPNSRIMIHQPSGGTNGKD